MACLNLASGFFVPSPGWSNADSGSTSDGTVSITRSTANLVVSKGGSSLFFSVDSLFKTFGNQFLFILYKQSSVTGIDRSISVVDCSGSTLSSQIVVSLYATSTTISDPTVHLSAGNNTVFMAVSPRNSGERRVHGFFRSDNGDVVESIGYVSVTSPGDINGRVEGGNLQVFYSGSWHTVGPVPAGECDVIPNIRVFSDAVIGADIPGLDVQTEAFTLENNGNDCLQINSISSAGPFSVTGSTPSMPVSLDPSDSISVTVQFAPTGVDTFDEDLPINPTPPDGDTHLKCEGESVAAVTSITFPGSAGFGTVPVGTTSSRTVEIRNNGQKNVSLNIPASGAGDLPFSWGAFAGTLAPGADHDHTVEFSPTSEGSESGTIHFSGSDPDSPHQINLSGVGCVPHAEMEIQVPNPASPYIDFGEVQRGFRTVQVIHVLNNGDGPLNFSARIQGGDAALFGIQREGVSVTSPTSNETFTVLPSSPCGGAAGPGEVFFALTFFANDAPPKTAQSQFIVYNHNATNGLPAEIAYDLQAEIIAPVSVDVELVLDRSGSMGDPSGERDKIDTAIDAGKLFVELMRPNVEDRLGIVRFNDTPQVVSSIQNVTSGNQGAIGMQINHTNFNPTGNTSIAGGVRVAVKDIDDNPRATTPDELNTAIVVLTDGMDNTPYADPDGNTYSLLGEDPGTVALPSTAPKMLYAVGIGDSIDTARLSMLAQASGGEFLHVHDFSGTDFFALEKHFTQIFMEAVNLALISDPVFTIQPNTQHVIPIDVLNGDTGLMVVVYDREFIRLPFYLETPGGEIVELTSVPAGFQVRPGITNTARFLEIKFPGGEPERYGGQWKLVIYHDGRACVYRPPQERVAVPTHGHPFPEQEFESGFRPRQCEEGYDKPILYGIAVGVGSNFRMFPLVQPGVIHVGETIQSNAIVSEYGLPVTGCDVTVKVRTPSGTIYNYSMYDDGAHQDDEADDGTYGKVYIHTSEEGFYTFTFRATGHNRDGEPVVREAVRSKYVEGTRPVAPPATGQPDPGGEPGSDPGRAIADCCRRLQYLLWALIVLVIVLIGSRWLF